MIWRLNLHKHLDLIWIVDGFQLALGNVISALDSSRQPGRHVPYRDSKLTRLLQVRSHTQAGLCLTGIQSSPVFAGKVTHSGRHVPYRDSKLTRLLQVRSHTQAGRCLTGIQSSPVFCRFGHTSRQACALQRFKAHPSFAGKVTHLTGQARALQAFKTHLSFAGKVTH